MTEVGQYVGTGLRFRVARTGVAGGHKALQVSSRISPKANKKARRGIRDGLEAYHG